MKSIYKPQIKIFVSGEEQDRFVAQKITDQIQRKTESVVTIATGNSTKKVFQVLIDLYGMKKADFKKTKFFVLDEYWPIKKNSIISTHARIVQQFFQYINAPDQNIFYPFGNAPILDTEIERYENLYRKFGPLDLAVVGIGPGKTCHIGLNEQGASKSSRIHYQSLDEESKQALIQKYNLRREDLKIKGGITLGIGNILESKEIILIAKGERKAWGIKRSLEGKINSESPASFLRYRNNVIFALDKDAAKLLRK